MSVSNFSFKSLIWPRNCIFSLSSLSCGCCWLLPILFFLTNCGKPAPSVDAVGVNVDDDDDDGLTKDVDEDEVGNLVDDNCCGIDVDDGKLVGVVARPVDDDVAGKLVGVVALAIDGVVVVADAAAAAVVVGGGIPDFLTNKIIKLKKKKA